MYWWFPTDSTALLCFLFIALHSVTVSIKLILNKYDCKWSFTYFNVKLCTAERETDLKFGILTICPFWLPWFQTMIKGLLMLMTLIHWKNYLILKQELDALEVNHNVVLHLGNFRVIWAGALKINILPNLNTFTFILTVYILEYRPNLVIVSMKQHGITITVQVISLHLLGFWKSLLNLFFQEIES